jgi:hypothetical protein
MAAGTKVIVDRCAITFADNRSISVLNCNPGGFADDERARLYREFVRDLHGRLAAGAYGAIRFSCGLPL